MNTDRSVNVSGVSIIEHFARICSLSDWRNVRMAMLTSAFDCSATGDSHYFVMAGFVTSAEYWQDFDREWRARLKADGLDYFHMNPFSHCTTHPQKPFDRSWIGAEERRRVLLDDLLGIIQGNAWKKMACIIPIESFLVFSDGNRDKYVPKQIVLAGRLLWSELEVWRRANGFRNQAEMVFEHGDPGKGELMKAMEGITGQTPSFRHKKDNIQKGIVAFTPLQASDILAYECQKITAMPGRPMSEPLRFPYLQLEKIPGDIRVLQSAGANLMDEWLRVQSYFEANPLGRTPTDQ